MLVLVKNFQMFQVFFWGKFSIGSSFQTLSLSLSLSLSFGWFFIEKLNINSNYVQFEKYSFEDT